MAHVNLEDRINEISDHLAALIGDIRLVHPIEASARIADLRAWHRVQLQNLVVDAQLDETQRVTERINAIFDSGTS
jgi:hypothetical protein